jgi:hypothetical protein
MKATSKKSASSRRDRQQYLQKRHIYVMINIYNKKHFIKETGEANGKT